jgi:glycosyltransferase involved in cell wall biosynthesis
MKVCMVNSFYPPWIGGAERYVSNLSRELVKRGNEVTVYCSGRPLEAGESLEEGVKVRRMSTPMMLYGTPLVVFPHSFFAERYDVIHANFPSPYLAAVSAFAGALKRTPAVLTWHNDLPPITSPAGLLIIFHDALSPAYLNYFQRIIATTRVYANSSSILKRYSKKVAVVHNGVDTKVFNPDVDGRAIKDLHGLWEHGVLLFVGALTRWHGYKGLDVLLEALLLVRERCQVKLIVVGEGPMKPFYEDLARRQGLQNSVVFAGRVDDSTLPLYYAASDILVLPSKDSSEGFGLVLLEAMASGKAVIGSRVGGVVEVITDGENGVLVNPNDAESLSIQIVSLLGDDELRARIGSNGRAFAESHDWSAVARRVEQIYDEIR